MSALATSPTPVVSDLGGSWPFAGRKETLELIVDDLVRTPARAVVVGGVAGAGKTRLLNEVASRAQARDVIVAKVTASGSASSIPFGAIAPLLPVEKLLPDSGVGLLQRAARVIAELGEGRPVVLAVDDAHLLDEASATLIHQLALEGTVRLLLTIRQGEHISAALAGVVSHPSTVTVELHQLSRPDVEQLAVQVLGPDVDGAVIQSLWDGSQGNPLYLRELLVGSVEDGSIELHSGVWRLVGKPDLPTRLVELIEARLVTVTDEEQGALELLAVGHALGRTALEDLVGTPVVSRLVQRGLVIAGREGRRQPVRLQHPLYAETLRRRLSSRRLRATQRQLADLVERGGSRRKEDRLHVTTLRLEAGGRLDLELLEAAALDAYFAFDLELCERLARAGVAGGGGPRIRRVLAEVLRWQGRHEEAEVILSTTALTGENEEERTLTALVRAENLFRGHGELEAAMRVLQDAQTTTVEPAWRDEITALGAVFCALAGDVRTALAIAGPIIERGPSRAMTVASTATVAALTFSGRSDDAVATAEAAFTVASSLAPQESQAVAATHVMERCLALIESGRLEEGEMLGRLSYEWSLAGGHVIGQGWFSMLLGRSAQTSGRLEESIRRFRESALVWRDLRDQGLRRWALAGLAETAAASGRVAEASMALDELDTAPRTSSHLLEAEVLRARAWLAIGRHAAGEGRRLLSDAVEWAADRGQHGLELTMLHDLVRIGDVRAGAERAAELAPTLQGQLASARGIHAEAARSQDAARHDEAAAAFAAIGANLYAAEAAAQAAVLHRRAGRTSSAAASAATSADLASLCDGAATPALDDGDDDGAPRLTPREHELATLAAAGRSSADIATQLGISVRTVNNLLQRAYSKLGVSGRRELPARLTQL